jgi:hypothetical protein
VIDEGQVDEITYCLFFYYADAGNSETPGKKLPKFRVVSAKHKNVLVRKLIKSKIALSESGVPKYLRQKVEPEAVVEAVAEMIFGPKFCEVDFKAVEERQTIEQISVDELDGHESAHIQ